MEFPGGKRFCFSIFDDTDDAMVDNVKPVYDYLYECGLRTSKTVWPMDCPEGSRVFFASETLQGKPYCDFAHELVSRGLELALHGATMESCARKRMMRGLEFLQCEFGLFPRLHCNHCLTGEISIGGLNGCKVIFCVLCFVGCGVSLVSPTKERWSDLHSFGAISAVPMSSTFAISPLRT
jgi:hypothetical protein